MVVVNTGGCCGRYLDGRRLTQGVHHGRRWPAMVAWWVVMSLVLLPLVTVLTQMMPNSIPDLNLGPLHVPLRLSPEAARRLSTSYQYFSGIVALSGVVGAISVLLVAIVRWLRPGA